MTIGPARRAGTLPVLVNRYEQHADRLLQEVEDEFGDRLLTKVRLADVIDPVWANWSQTISGYGQRAHLDFVMVDAETSRAKFAVELDGRGHSTDPKQRWRDATKGRLCRAANLPLIRVNSSFGMQEGRHVLLKYLCEIFYRAEAFYAAQERGQIPLDEPFMHFSFIEQDANGRLLFGSFDAIARAKLHALADLKRIPHGVPDSWTGQEDVHGDVRAEVYLCVGNAMTVMGGATVRAFGNFGISAGELAEEIAVVHLFHDVQGWIRGDAVALNPSTFKAHFRSFVAASHPYSGTSSSTPDATKRIPYPPFTMRGLELVWDE